MGKRIILGSGHLYRTDYTAGTTINDPETYCVDANRFSHIKGGATLELTQEKQQEEDDMGLVRKTKLNVDAAKFTCGMMTIEGAMLQKVLATASAVESVAAASGKKAKNKVKIGGITNEEEASSLWVFHHPDKKDGDIWIMFVGTNNGNLSFEFKKDGVTLPSLEINADPMDSEGRKVYFYEEVKSAAASTPH